MKMNPITFQLNTQDGEGFDQFRDNYGNWVYRRDVVLRPFIWNSGSAAEFKIIEFYSDIRTHEIKQRDLCTMVFYDHECPTEQTELSNLASNDLRGRAAESTAHHLYWKLFLPTEEMKKYMPKLVEWYEHVMKNVVSK